jgi:hypothetical protein
MSDGEKSWNRNLKKGYWGETVDGFTLMCS